MKIFSQQKLRIDCVSSEATQWYECIASSRVTAAASEGVYLLSVLFHPTGYSQKKSVVFTATNVKVLNAAHRVPFRQHVIDVVSTCIFYNSCLFPFTQYCNGGDLADYLQGKHCWVIWHCARMCACEHCWCAFIWLVCNLYLGASGSHSMTSTTLNTDYAKH